jgi:hypothetical protein
MTNNNADATYEQVIGLPFIIEETNQNLDNVYYQILVVEYQKAKVQGRQCIKTTLVTRTKKEFKNFTINSHDCGDIGSQLPTSGVTLDEAYLKIFFNKQLSPVQQAKLINNLYDVIRRLLSTRKLSQLIAKTWHSYLIAKTYRKIWSDYTQGKWQDILNTKSIEGKTLEPDLLNNLIARDIFLSDYKSQTITIDTKDKDVYKEFKLKNPENRFLILPSSRAWQNIALSLLLAGQAYYKLQGNEKYYQISPSILSTGEIIAKFGIEITLDKFTGIIKEVLVNPEEFSTAFPVVIPYPPIPSEHNLALDDIGIWAYAEDKEGNLPFYGNLEQKDFTVRNVSPPYPYIPLSCLC